MKVDVNHVIVNVRTRFKRRYWRHHYMNSYAIIAFEIEKELLSIFPRSCSELFSELRYFAYFIRIFEQEAPSSWLIDHSSTVNCTNYS
ncbi:unnamed protein product [Amoebophrya sp. A25]|nr:unnamed protein product [Amoebophrya sp. A25]|eukprot:GSA25T00017385001.1